MYCEKHDINVEKFQDLESERNRSILQGHFNDLSGYPSYGDKDEYSFYFEKYFPKSIDRKCFFQEKVNNANPTIGHKSFGQLIVSRRVDSVFTTNFDELLESGIKAINPSESFIVFTPDNVHQIDKLRKSSYPKIIKLHGDYRYDKLKNTGDETQRLDSELNKYFSEILLEKGLIVLGYSGNDESIMKALREASTKVDSFPFGLIWCIRKGDKPRDEIIQFVEEINKKNNLSGFLEVDASDEFLYNLYESSDEGGNATLNSLGADIFKKKLKFSLKQAKQSKA